MENEEYIGLIDKKAYEDQFDLFVSSVLDLSHYSLSFSFLDTQSFLGALWHWIKKGKEGKRKEGASKEEKDQATTAGLFVGIVLHV